MDIVALNDASLLHLFLQQHKPDVLLMDIGLGDYDGMDLCRQVKRTPKEKKTAVVLFTARTYTSDTITASLADAFIEKPFHIQQLYRVVEKFLPQ